MSDINRADREELGKRVREMWIAWAKTRPEPKPSWLVPWEELGEPDREVDRQIGETIAEEAQDELLKELDQLRIRKDEELATMRRRAVKAEGRQARAAWLGLCTTISALILLGVVYGNIPEPVACPPMPAPVVCPPPAPVVGDGSASDGYWITGEMGDHLHPWPDASNYPAEQFEIDCRDVCAVPEGYGRDATPGHVLMMDPSRLVCVCFHPDSHGSSWSVARWVGWEHVR